MIDCTFNEMLSHQSFSEIIISDTPHRGLITNVFALSSKMGIALGWGSLIVYTPELYPTVVR